MRKLLICLGIILMTSTVAFSATIPDDIQQYISNDFPKTNFRFDGLVILPDNTIYLPLFPAQIINPDTIEIKETIPASAKLSSKPNIIIFNNDFVLLKVMTDTKGNRTIYKMANPPLEVRTGLLPQDLLVPKGLVIPENLKSIIGNLLIPTIDDPGIRIERTKPIVTQLNGSTLKTLAQIPALKNKNFYVSSPYSKNIQVLNLGAKTPEYSLKQNNVPISMKAYNNEFLLVTAYDKPSVDVISLADDQIIKQIFTKTQPDEILIDKNKNIAYISSSLDSSIYMLNLETMTLSKQIKITGMCEKLTLSDDGTKLFYYDKRTRDIWAIELDNNYLLKEIGKFPNVSKILYANNKIYVTSRTKNRLAIIDYDTIGLMSETEICEKPIDMIEFHNRIYILGAGDNSIQILDAKTDELTNSIYLGTNGFSTRISHIEDTNIALITDTKASLYTVFDLGTNSVIKTVPIDIPANSIVVTEKVKKIK
jgi:DNA-binding beta-propeller fold protein YncE